MSKVYYTFKLLVLYFLGVELFFSGSLLDLLDTIGSLAKHSLFLLHQDRPNSDHTHTYLADRELLHFLRTDPRRQIDNTNAHG